MRFVNLMLIVALAMTLLTWSQALFAQVGSPTPSQEALLNKLFAPGPLQEGHRDLEAGDCLKCHDAGKGLPESKCLDCHREIKPFVEEKRGFHGLVGKHCIECHKDHKGREYDSAIVDQEKFDHERTGYKLTGKHSEVKCGDCHKDRRGNKVVKGFKPTRPHDIRYIGQTTTCVSCHKKDDIHFFAEKTAGNWAKKDCNTCHTTTAWQEVTDFDHGRDTKFKLEGNHSDLTCVDCHKPKENKEGTTLKMASAESLGQYHWEKLATAQCLNCHANFHGENLSKEFQNGDCAVCHLQTTWAIKKFDHKVTGYPLRGKHAESKCVVCHKQDSERLKQGEKAYRYQGLKSDCLTCHKDHHYYDKFKSPRLKRPGECLTCHNESKWTETHDFNHTTDSRFILDGKHGDLQCNDCHRPDKEKKGLELPLRTGKAVGVYHWEKLMADTCATCHINPHRETFSPQFLEKKCTECHVTEGWLVSPAQSKKDFDHDTTRFVLNGVHQKTECSACHNLNGKQVFKFPTHEKQFCVDCHRSPHEEQFHKKFTARSCAECHSTESFSERKGFDHAATTFALRGKHMELKCAQCHEPTEQALYAKKNVTWHKFIFPNLEKDSCSTCHQDYHKGQLGSRCETCHSEQGWGKVKFDHDKSDFPLKDKHKEVKCGECHRPLRDSFITFGADKKKYQVVKYKPLSDECISCHREEDKHKGQYGQDCNNCHSERGWKVVKDFHKNFSLHGTHFALSCTECHRQERQLSGMSDNCVLCHQRDDIHNGSLPNCGECHRQQFWEHAAFRHSTTIFPLRGSHRTLDCFECHNRGIYHGTPTNCTSCHSSDVNNTNFNHTVILNVQECSTCHNQFTFDLGF